MTFNSGLSPLARGTQGLNKYQSIQCRFIPAGAGNTQHSGNICHPSPVYPRWRGEHPGTPTRQHYHFGLSPLARGTQGHKKEPLYRRRFIPAGAGNTPGRPSDYFGVSVYPRWRGEHRVRCASYKKLTGLSPLARGTRDSVFTATINRRFIPAGAGNTSRFPQTENAVQVYPRWRGEHTAPRVVDHYPGGLSPLARGTPVLLFCAVVTDRFIPAGAGNTLRHGSELSTPQVYPRWRGEHAARRDGR